MSFRLLLLTILAPLSLFFHLQMHYANAQDLAAPKNLIHKKIEKVVLAQFGKEKFLLYLPLYIAMEEGLFHKRGIDVELKFAGNDDQIFASIVGESALFGMGDPVFAAIAKDKGGPGKIVALTITKLGLSGFTNKPSIPIIRDPQDAKGLRFGSFPSPSTTFRLISEFIDRNSLEGTGTKAVQVAIGAQMAALEAGDIDIAVDLEPSVSIAEDKGYRVVFDLDKHSPSQAITGISTLESTISSKPHIVQALVSGIQESLNILHTDKDRVLRVARKLFPSLKEQIIQNAIQRMLAVGMYPKTAQVNDEYWQRTLKTRLDSGELRAPQATSITVDNRFAEIAAKELN